MVFHFSGDPWLRGIGSCDEPPFLLRHGDRADRKRVRSVLERVRREPGLRGVHVGEGSARALCAVDAPRLCQRLPRAPGKDVYMYGLYIDSSRLMCVYWHGMCLQQL